MNSTIKRMRITVEGIAYDVAVEMLDDVGGRPVSVAPPVARLDSPATATAATPAVPSRPAARPAGAVPSPLAGTIVSVEVSIGQHVESGDLLVTLEAMKMKAPVRAPSAGTVASIEAKAGVAVEEGATLLVLS